MDSASSAFVNLPIRTRYHTSPCLSTRLITGERPCSRNCLATFCAAVSWVVACICTAQRLDDVGFFSRASNSAPAGGEVDATGAFAGEGLGLVGTAAEAVEVGEAGFAGTVAAVVEVGGETGRDLAAAATAAVVVEGEADLGGTTVEAPVGAEANSG
jgi:hypothetical protein